MSPNRNAATIAAGIVKALGKLLLLIIFTIGSVIWDLAKMHE